MAKTLLIENGQLLKPYAIPWREDGWRKPSGWTAANDEWIENRAVELIDGWRNVLDKEPVPEIAYNQARQERGELLQAERKPWPGWVPTNPRADPKISKAYWELFKQTNADLEFPMPQHVLEKRLVKWPSDGYYTFSNGEMKCE